MGFFDRAKKWIVKNIFGFDVDRQGKRIKNLQKKIKSLKDENAKLKETIRKQNILIEDMNENLEFLFKRGNKLVEFHIYFGVQGRKRATIRNFEFIISGVCINEVSELEFTKLMTQDNYLRFLINQFDINWLDYHSFTSSNLSGYTESLIDRDTDDKLNVSLVIQDGGMDGSQYAKVDNKWKARD